MAAAFQGALRSESAGTLVQRYQQRVRLDLLENATKAAARPTGWRAIFAERVSDFCTRTPVLRAVVRSLHIFSENQLVTSAVMLPFVAVMTANSSAYAESPSVKLARNNSSSSTIKTFFIFTFPLMLTRYLYITIEVP